jgi:hypothetical protein
VASPACSAPCAYGGGATGPNRCSAGELQCGSSGECCPSATPYYSASTGECYATIDDACTSSGGACPLQCL